MKLTIITINYNSSENTIKLLESLKNQTDPAQSNSADRQQKGQTLSGTSKDFEVIVVDNNSDDVGKLMDYQTSTEFLDRLKHGQETTPSKTNIIYIKNDRNLGYSGGNNIGIKKALENGALRQSSGRADWVLLLNNDTWVESSFVERLKADLEGKGGIIGLALDEGNKTASYAGKIEWLKPTLIHLPTSQVGMTKSVDKLYTIGGAMLIHKDVFDKIGFLDEKYFLYFEDADFTLRARKAGVKVGFLPKIKVQHSISSSTKKLGSPVLLRYHHRNALYFNLKNGPWYIKLLVWPWSWFVTGKQILKIAMGKNRKESKAILAGIMDFYGNKMGKIKTGP